MKETNTGNFGIIHDDRDMLQPDPFLDGSKDTFVEYSADHGYDPVCMTGEEFNQLMNPEGELKLVIPSSEEDNIIQFPDLTEKLQA